MNKVLETLRRILDEAPNTNIDTQGRIYKLSDDDMPTAGAVRYVKRELRRLEGPKRFPVVTDKPPAGATDSTQPPVI